MSQSQKILMWDTQILMDESIERYQFREYVPQVGAGELNGSSAISLVIESQDVFTHPHKSYLFVKGILCKNVDTNDRYADADQVTLVNNGIMHLFSQITYDISGRRMESLNFPGQATTMLGLLKYSDDFARTKGLNQCWMKDDGNGDFADSNGGGKTRTSYIASSNEKGNFSFCIPLAHIFGFFEDYDKILYGVKQELTLQRKTSNNAAIYKGRGAAGGAAVADIGKVVLTKLSWFVPHVIPDDEVKYTLYKQIEEGIELKMGYKSRRCEKFVVPESTEFTWKLGQKSADERPRFLIVGFQPNNYETDQIYNTGLFQWKEALGVAPIPITVTNTFVTLNSDRYPERDYTLNFGENNFSRVLIEAQEFKANSTGIPDVLSNGNINPVDFKKLYPLFVFNLSKQSAKLRASIVDMEVTFRFSNPPAANTMTAYAVILSDKIVQFQGDGKRSMAVTM